MAESDGEGLDGFRAEVRAWLDANCPAEMRGPMHEDDQFFGDFLKPADDGKSKVLVDTRASPTWASCARWKTCWPV